MILTCRLGVRRFATVRGRGARPRCYARHRDGGRCRGRACPAQRPAGGVWEQLAGRLPEVPEYGDRFVQVFPGVDEVADISFVHAANAIAASRHSLGVPSTAPSTDTCAVSAGP